MSMLLNTGLASIVAGLAADYKKAYPQLVPGLDKAMEIIRAGGMTKYPSGDWDCPSETTRGKTYRLTKAVENDKLTCCCKHATSGQAWMGKCKHVLAVSMVRTAAHLIERKQACDTVNTVLESLRVNAEAEALKIDEEIQAIIAHGAVVILTDEEHTRIAAAADELYA